MKVNDFDERIANMARGMKSFPEAKEEARRKEDTLVEFPHGQQEEEGPYKGFLMIQCEECGEVKGFCARKETYVFRCDKCGHRTPLTDLKPMYMNCKCGDSFRYKTNITDDSFKRNCLSCGASVDMVLNQKGTAYITPGQYGRR